MTVTSKPARLNFRMLAAVLILFGTVACSTQASPSPNVESSGEKATTPTKVTEPTTFSCLQQQGGWATFAKRGDRNSESPLITWNTTEFGSGYTPENRCQIVSQKLTDAVAKNQGLLGKLQLTTGLVNGLTVVCVIAPEQKSCNPNNQLFTLSKENAKDPNKALVQITNFAYGKGERLEESRKFPSIISLETLVNRLLPKDIRF